MQAHSIMTCLHLQNRTCRTTGLKRLAVMHGSHVNKLQTVYQDADARPSPEVCHDGACPLTAVICFVVKVLSIKFPCLIPVEASNMCLCYPAARMCAKITVRLLYSKKAPSSKCLAIFVTLLQIIEKLTNLFTHSRQTTVKCYKCK